MRGTNATSGLDRRLFLGLSMPLAAAAIAAPAVANAATAATTIDIEAELAAFRALADDTACLVEVGAPGPSFRAGHREDEPMFVGSAIKVFILTEYLRRMEKGELDESAQLTVDDAVRSLSSPVLLHMSGTMPARSILEAMITHSDNTATDIAMATVGVERVRALIAEAKLSSVAIPASTRRMFSYIAGAPEGVDEGWAGMQKMDAGELFGPARSAVGGAETMMASASDFVSFYRRALEGDFFETDAALTEFRRITGMADALARALPPGIAGYAKGGSIDWLDFHALALPGQMVVCGVPVTFSFSVNWTGPQEDVPKMMGATGGAIAALLGKIATALA